MKESMEGSSHPLFKTGKCLTCHDAHGSNIGGMIVKKQASLCFSCHDKHLGEEIKDVKSTHAPFAEATCTKCHSPHKAKLDSLVLAGNPGLCFTCHEDLKAEIFKEQECARAKEREDQGLPAGKMSVKCDDVKLYVHARSELIECDKCHRPHFAQEPALINKPVQALCEECHDYEKESFSKSHINIDPAVIDCRKCHDPHTSKDPKFFKEEIHPLFKARACEECHMVEKQ